MIDTFFNFGWRTPLKSKFAETIKDSSENILIISKRKPNLIETGRGKEFYNIDLQNFLNNNNIEHYSRNTSLGVFLLSNSTLLLEIYLKDLFLKKGMVNGLIYYLQ